MESRVKKSFLNARTNLIFYALVLGVTFISRRAFLEILGKDFVGLTTTLSNMLGLMNLAEMGVGAAIGYMLYKPLFERDTAKINQIISVFGYIYNRIGLAVLGIAVIVSCFLPLIFSRTSIPMGVIFFAYYSFLGSSLLSYFANYRQLLLGADQKQYVVTTYIQSANILRLLIQTGLASYTSNLYVGGHGNDLFRDLQYYPQPPNSQNIPLAQIQRPGRKEFVQTISRSRKIHQTAVCPSTCRDSVV